MKKANEIGGLLLLLLLGLTPRLLFIAKYPTIPYSDFRALVSFGEELHKHGIFTNGWFWEYFNPGVPLVLSMLFRIVPGDPGSVARWATAVICGILPIFPYLVWRGVLPPWVRLLAGGALALWPGQICFSGVVAQDSWVLVPTVGLAVLAVRVLLSDEPGYPMVAGLLLAAGVIMRQEMVVVLLPLFLAAAGVTLRTGRRQWVTAVLSLALPLLVCAGYRDIATGRFSLGTEHGGLSILGAYVPGATATGWIDPYPYIASVRPDLLRDRKSLLHQMSGLALREALRRPKFQAVRIVSMMCTATAAGEANSLFWSVGAPEVLPEGLRAQGSAFVLSNLKPLRYEMAGIQGLFVAALLIALWRRNWPILVVASAVLLKFAIHAIVAAQGRYFFPATAMEILAITLATYELRKAVPGRIPLGVIALAVGMGFSAGLLVARFRLGLYVASQDVDQQRTYRFPLEVPGHNAMLDCVMSHGVLVDLNLPREGIQTATIRTTLGDPPWGDAATAVCQLTGTGEPRPMNLQVLDPYAPGGFPDRMVQRVEVDGVEVFSHDFAKDPGSGWAKVPLGNVGEGTSRKVLVEVKAVRPEPGPGWGNAAATTFRLSR